MAFNLVARYTNRALALTKLTPACSKSFFSTKLIARPAGFQSMMMLKKQPTLVPSNLSSVNRFYASDEKLDKGKIEEKVLDILKNFDRIKENPDKPKITLESHLTKDLGLDSLDQVEIIVQLEDAFGYEIPDSDYEKLLTPAAIVNYIEKRLTQV